jgi:DNA-directed RNA polymerase subunit M/transcription elongation factor TFIIS
MNWLYSNAIGGVKIHIAANDLEKAKEIMTAESGNQCPKCASHDVIFEKFSRRPLYLGWLFLSIPFPHLKNEWKCLKCGHTWKDSEPNSKNDQRE